ncbi:uncharacterized protein LOC122280745 [Carya illinoinensis]|uniref:Uncharacterized protein n=1 Tax=Carya illinoinensis TaxID=32201 RepID=A0A922DPN1_CARIL|nr:uncharacterized protein LOC122280745 [Carya illinoinensis]KAG6688349.1 hypothetical protein I3842_11G120400 [Carya illinoinensis]
MGNCMETYTQRQQAEGMQQQQQQQEGYVGERASGLVKESSFKQGGIRVKIVLTKEELEWFMLQLKNKEGKVLEDVFREIERGRSKVEGWKPSLESIMESPEVLEMDR